MSMTIDPELLKIIEKTIQEKIEKSLESYQKSILKELFLTREEFLEEMKKLDENFERLINQMNRGFVEAKKERIELSKGFVEAKKERTELKAFISKVSTTRGVQLEKAVLDLLNEQLIQETIDVSEIKKESLIDKEGRIYYENYNTDIDILIQDGKTILIEIKSGADNRDINDLLKKAELFKILKNKNYDALMLFCLEINQRNFEEAIKQGIRVIAGQIV